MAATGARPYRSGYVGDVVFSRSFLLRHSRSLQAGIHAWAGVRRAVSRPLIRMDPGLRIAGMTEGMSPPIAEGPPRNLFPFTFSLSSFVSRPADLS